jgi:PAS domain S-box-containing protein
MSGAGMGAREGGGEPLARHWPGGNARCHLVTEYASDMISVHDVDEAATYLYVSPAVQRLFGYEPPELAGRSAFDFIHPAEHATIAEYATRLRTSPDIATVRYRLRRKAGEYEWVETTCRMIFDPLTGEPAEVIATTRSAEARVALEQEQERLLEEADRARAVAEAANRTKDEFLAMISHEFRTPLNAISGHVQLLTLGIHGPLSDAQHDALLRVDRAQRFLLRLINDLLNVARLKAGQLDYDIQPVALGEVFAELDSMIGPQLEAKSIAYEVRVDPSTSVLADREKLVQVLLNLLSNAVKFTPAGGRVTIDTARRASVPNAADHCFIRVRDTGAGVPLNKQSAIFEPFVRVDTSSSARTVGAGLGLSISRDLARGMGGELRVRGGEGAGASFTLSLPFVESRTRADDDHTSR